MADPRSFERRGPFSLEFLAEAVGGALDAATDRRTPIRDVASLDLAGPDDIGFLDDNRPVDIGANATIDRGAAGDTVRESGCVIDNLVQIAHNVSLGQGCITVAQAGISGSSRLEDQVVLGGQAGLSDHLKVGKGARVAAQGGVMRDIEPGGEIGGSPAMPIRQWHRQTVALTRLARRKGD